MASDDYTPVNYVGVNENAFFFDASEDTEVDGDSFGRADECSKYLIKNKGKCLLLDDEEFQKQFLPTQQQSQPDCKCNIQIYHDSTLQEMQMKPVMLFFIKEEKKMVACCRNLNDVCPEVMDPPRNIPEDAHKAVFYLERIAAVSNKYMFQSSLYRGQYLGFQSEGQACPDKLVLLEIPPGEVNESCHFSLFQSK